MTKSEYVREVLNVAWNIHEEKENKKKEGRKKYERKKRVAEAGKN